MSCAEIKPLLPLLASRELDSADAQPVEAHCGHCPACESELKEFRSLHDKLAVAFETLAPRDRGALPPGKKRRLLWSRPVWAVAACLMVAVGIHFIWSHDPAPLPFVPVEVSKGPYGQTKLDDGTIVFASAGSKWEENGSRQLQLTRGELLVRVAQDAEPFRVTTPAGEAIARGTKFFIDVRTTPLARDAEPVTQTCVTILEGEVDLTNSWGRVTGTRGEVLASVEKSAPSKHVEDLALRFAQHYKPVDVQVVPKVPAYELPLDLEQVVNLKDVANKLGISLDEESLRKNGFVVIPGKDNESVVTPYTNLKAREVPIFITTDTLLHLYHVQFDETLREIEEREFYPDLLALTEALVAKVSSMPMPKDEAFQEARTKVVTYLAVALRSLNPNAWTPWKADRGEVNKILDLMKKHEGFFPEERPDFRNQEGDKFPLFRYSEDFSQYVPRGHYTRSENLKRYFKAMMWYGRMAFLIKGHEEYGPMTYQPALISEKEADRQTLAAAIMTQALNETRLADNRSGREVWERMYGVTAFYVGLADDLGLQEFQAALSKVCGATLDVTGLADEQRRTQFRAELARFPKPAIYGGTGGQGVEEELVGSAGPSDLATALDKSTGFRFMGQRFVPDSHMMGKLVTPSVGQGTNLDAFTAFMVPGVGIERVFPRGLDVMAVLGSKRAREIIRELGDDTYPADGKRPSYDTALEELRKEYGAFNDNDWNRNLYWSWLHALKPLCTEFKEGYPTFMTTEAYRTKSLNTALASWAQLRHDTILYAKQSYTINIVKTSAMVPPKPVQGYVEPVPEFYARLLTLSRMTYSGLSDMNVLNEEAKKRLTAFDALIERLLRISEKELANEELTEADYMFIRGFGAKLSSVVISSKPRVTEKSEKMTTMEEDKPMKTTIIADVHTDQNSEECLEEGTGYVDLGLFVYRQPDGRLVLGAGPILSYYEFKQPMRDRLTDEKWREMLSGSEAPQQPPWTKAYLSSKSAYTCPLKDE